MVSLFDPARKLSADSRPLWLGNPFVVVPSLTLRVLPGVEGVEVSIPVPSGPSWAFSEVKVRLPFGALPTLLAEWVADPEETLRSVFQWNGPLMWGSGGGEGPIKTNATSAEDLGL